MSSARLRLSGSCSSRHRRIDHVAQHGRARNMRGLHDDRIGRDQSRACDADRIARRRLRDGRALGLRLIEQRERSAAAPADDHDPLVAPLLFGVPDIGAEIEQHLFEDERSVVLGIAAGRAQHMPAGLHRRLRHRQKLQRRGRMHEDQQRGGGHAFRRHQQALEIDRALIAGKAVGFDEGRVFLVLDVNPAMLDVVLCHGGVCHGGVMLRNAGARNVIATRRRNARPAVFTRAGPSRSRRRRSSSWSSSPRTRAWPHRRRP